MEHGEKLSGMIQFRELQHLISQNHSSEVGTPPSTTGNQAGSFWNLIQLVGEKACRNTVLLMDRDNVEVFYTKVSEIEELFYCLSHHLQHIISRDQPFIIQIQQSSEISNACTILIQTAMRHQDEHHTWYPSLEGKKIRCSTCEAKHRLFIGNVPRNWMEDDMKKAVTKIGPGVTSVQLMKDPKVSSRNRGYAFIEYYNNACAEYSRKKMSTVEFKLDDNAPAVSWADPRSGDSTSTSQVKSIYVKNLPKNVTQDQLKKLFQHHGQITRVVLPTGKPGQENRIGFVHFAERATSMKALQNTERYELGGKVLECSLAKPPADNKGDNKFNVQRGPMLPSYQPALLGGP